MMTTTNRNEMRDPWTRQDTLCLLYIVAGIAAVIYMIGWGIQAGLDRDAEMDEQNCHEYWEMRSGAPDDRYE